MRKLSVLLLSVIAVTYAFTSCYKKKDTIARITVVDAAGAPKGGVEVRVYYEDLPNGDPREYLDQTSTTDASGMATFNYNDLYKSGQAGFAILDIDADGNTKVGIVRIEEETTSEETVEIP